MSVIVCPICSTRYRVAESQLSKASRLKCKKCKTVFPVSDNIRAEESGPEEVVPGVPLAGPSPDVQSQQATSQSNTLNLNEMTLDFDPSTASSSAPTLDFSFSAAMPDEPPPEEADEGNQIQDHIASGSQQDQGHLEVGLGNLPFGGAQDGESTLSMDHNLNFLSNAPSADFNLPTEEPLPSEHVPGQPGGQELSLDNLGLGQEAPPDDATMTMSGAAEPVSSGSLSDLSFVEGPSEAEVVEEPPPADVAEVSRLESGVHIEFSGTAARIGDVATAPEEDFSDVEQALDKLADGTFEKEIKKREAAKYRGHRMKLIGAGIGVAIIMAITGLWWLFLRPDHSKLVARYQKLLAREETDPQAVVRLFIDAVKQQDQDIFSKLSVMPKMPTISSAKVLTVGALYDEAPPVNRGQEITTLRGQVDALKKDYADAEKKWQQESSLNLSVDLINTNLQELLRKQQALQAEYKAEEAESTKKMKGLQEQIADAQKELEINRRRMQDYIDDTSQQGKAMYLASSRKVQSLEDDIGDLEARFAEERPLHQKRMDGINTKYDPRFAEFENELKKQQALLEKAKLSLNQETSPLALLDKQLKALKASLNEAEQSLQEKEQEFATALAFFKRSGQRQKIEQHRDTTTFTRVSRNVMTSMKYKGEPTRKIPVVLTRYQALIGTETVRGDWMVEKILKP